MPAVRRKAAFTLIELLVVIGIVAVLASMLMPAVGLVRDVANRTSCMSNQRQTLVAIEVYSQDWEGLLIPIHRPTWPSVTSWRVRLMVFDPSLVTSKTGAIQHSKVLGCDTQRRANPTTLYSTGTTFPTISTFSGNHSLSKDIDIGIPMSSIGKLSECMLFGDGAWVVSAISHQYYSYEERNDGDAMRMAFVHRQKANIAYADGHVAAIDGALYKDYETHAAGQPGWDFWFGGTR